MKKKMVKNIFTSICVTAFIVMIGLVIEGLVFNRIIQQNIIDSAETQQYEGLKEKFEENIKTYNSENGVIEYYKDTAEMVFTAEEIVYTEVAFGFVGSIIIGSIVGYLKTLLESRQDKKTVLKKAVLTFLVGLIIVALIVIIVDIARGGFDIENLVLYSLLYTIAYVAYFVSKLAIDNKKKRELNKLMNKDSK